MPKLPKKVVKSVKLNSEKKAPKAEDNGREIVYPTVEAKLCHDGKPITGELAKKILGWEEIEKGDALLTDANGKRIRCTYNVKNRPLYSAVYGKLKQEVLRKRWAGPNGTGTTINGEPIIVGKTGLLLNGQHTLIGLVLAVQEWENDREKWSDWEEAPVLDKVILFGIDELDAVIHTMDTCKARTLAEVIFMSKMFEKIKSKSAKFKMARICEDAIRMLWHRTGIDRDAFAPWGTHSEAIAFLNNHDKILECVKHIYEEEGDDRRITRYIRTGYAAGMMYLMASCKTSHDCEWHQATVRTESMLDMETWDEACEFWTSLASGNKPVAPVKTAITGLARDDRSISIGERMGVLIKAWELFLSKKPMTPSALALKYENDEDGIPHYAESPILGGIDRGIPEEDPVIDPSPEEIEEKAEEIRQENLDKKVNGKKNGKQTTKVSKKKKDSGIEEGTLVWVGEDGGYWTGTVTETYQGKKGAVVKVKTGNGKVFDAPLENCFTSDPEA